MEYVDSLDELAYTQGHWYADPTAQYEHMADCLLENQTWIAVEADDGHVAYCHPDNADLIAAAPDMLAVLVGIERAMGWIADNPDEPLIMSRSDFDAVRAAIAKASK